MTTTMQAPAPAPTAAPGGGVPDEEKKAAMAAIGAGFALGGPVGGVVMALAIGIEQAFGKSGWDQPAWLGGERPPAMTPEEIAQRHAEAVERAREYVAEHNRQAGERAAALKEHRRAMKEYVEGGRQGDKPQRPQTRNPWESLVDGWGMSKSWYRLFDDKMARGNEKVTGTYPAIADFFRNLWNFVTGFAEGIQTGWEQYQQQKQVAEPAPGPPMAPAAGPAPRLTEPAQPEPQQIGPQQPEPGPEPDQEPVKVTSTVQQPEPQPTPGPVSPGPATTELDPTPARPDEGPAEGEAMTTENAAALPAAEADGHMGPQGETNLDLMYQAFAPAAPVLGSVSEQVDELKPAALAITQRVARIAALCGINGAPVAVYQMMAEANAVAGTVGAGIVEIDTHNEVARELTDLALAGLVPATDDLNTTRAEQASGDLYNRAGH